MDHVADIVLLEFVAGRLPPPEREAVAAHLRACPACRERAEQTGRLWEALGAWEVPGKGPDLGPRVLDAARRESLAPAPRKHLRAAVGVAASVALAVGLGHLAGRLTWGGEADSAGAGPAGSQRVIGALYLEDFQEGSPGYFAQAVLGFDPQAAEESK
jgi:anti-sigma factor RsiW